MQKRDRRREPGIPDYSQTHKTGASWPDGTEAQQPARPAACAEAQCQEPGSPEYSQRRARATRDRGHDSATVHQGMRQHRVASPPSTQPHLNHVTSSPSMQPHLRTHQKREEVATTAEATERITLTCRQAALCPHPGNQCTLLGHHMGQHSLR